MSGELGKQFPSGKGVITLGKVKYKLRHYRWWARRGKCALVGVHEDIKYSEGMLNSLSGLVSSRQSTLNIAQNYGYYKTLLRFSQDIGQRKQDEVLDKRKFTEGEMITSALCKFWLGRSELFLKVTKFLASEAPSTMWYVHKQVVNSESSLQYWGREWHVEG